MNTKLITIACAVLAISCGLAYSVMMQPNTKDEAPQDYAYNRLHEEEKRFHTTEGVDWRIAPVVAEGLTDVGHYSCPTVFNMSGTWHCIAGEGDGTFHGFTWGGQNWSENESIVSGLGDYGSNTKPTVFTMGGVWYCLAGRSVEEIRGWHWNGSQWVLNASITTGIHFETPGDDIDLYPNVFTMDSVVYCIIIKLNGYSGGFKWNGSSWESNDTIIRGITHRDQSRSGGTAFCFNETWYFIISHEGDGDTSFYGFQYDESGWTSDTSIVAGLVCVANTRHCVFIRDDELFLLHGSWGGTFTGYRWGNFSTPVITTEDAQSVTFQNATLCGALDDDGGDWCTVWFEWGKNPTFGNNTTKIYPVHAGEEITCNLSGLENNTAYYYRAIVNNSEKNNTGNTKAFITQEGKPQVTTMDATGVGITTATLRGYLNCSGVSETSVFFEWGENITFGNTTPAETNVSAGTYVTYNLTNLSAGTTYYFHAVANNSAGITTGAIKTYTVGNIVPNVTTGSYVTLNETTIAICGQEVSDGAGQYELAFDWGLTAAYGTTVNATDTLSIVAIEQHAAHRSDAKDTTHVTVKQSYAGNYTYTGGYWENEEYFHDNNWNTAAESNGIYALIDNYDVVEINYTKPMNATIVDVEWTIKGMTGSSNVTLTLSSGIINQYEETIRLKIEIYYCASTQTYTKTAYGFSGSWTPLYVGSGNTIYDEMITWTVEPTLFYTILTGLDPGTYYFYRARAYTAVNETQGNLSYFCTEIIEPIITTMPVSFMGDSWAIISAEVEEDGGDYNDVWLEWGETPAYGNKAPTPEEIYAQDVYKCRYNFAALVSYDRVGVAHSMSIGDINNDGLIDVLVADGSKDEISMFIDRGFPVKIFNADTGTYDHCYEYETIGAVEDIVGAEMCDINNDGHMDIAAMGEEIVVWFENNGNGTFTQHTINSTLRWLWSMSVGDLNNDGSVDIVVSVEKDAFYWFENDGNGSFTAHEIPISGNNDGKNFAIADMNKDGHSDIVYGDRTHDTVYWLENDGNETFTQHELGGQTSTYVVHVADMDNDTHIDIVSGSVSGGGLYWWENNGNGTFTQHTINSTITVIGIDIFDQDGDGDMDLALGVLSPSPARMGVFINDGNQTFTQNTHQSSGIPHHVYAADLNGDENPEIITYDSGSSTKYIFIFEDTNTYATGGCMIVNITGLKGNTTYYYRGVGRNANTTAYGSQQSFTTETLAPTVTTNGTSNPGRTTTTVHGFLVDDGGEPADVWFRYGLNASMVNTTIATQKGSGEVFSANLTLLIPGMTYYYQAIANNSEGETNGTVQSFMTVLYAPTVLTNGTGDIGATYALVQGYLVDDGDGDEQTNASVWMEYGYTEDLGCEAGAGVHTMVGYFDEYASGEAWASVPEYMCDGNASNFSGLFDTQCPDVQKVTRHTLEEPRVIQEIRTVKIRFCGAIAFQPTTANISIRPVFPEGDGDDHMHYVTWSLYVEKEGKWHDWTDITNDTHAPTAWTWADVQGLDIDVEAINCSGDPFMNVVYCSMIQIQVTYVGGETKVSGEEFEVNLTNLLPGKTYYFRSAAHNTNGTSYGDITSFTLEKTTPTIEQGALSDIYSTNATIQGFLANDGGDPCSVWFEYGDTPALGNSSPSEQHQSLRYNCTAFTIDHAYVDETLIDFPVLITIPHEVLETLDVDTTLLKYDITNDNVINLLDVEVLTYHYDYKDEYNAYYDVEADDDVGIGDCNAVYAKCTDSLSSLQFFNGDGETLSFELDVWNDTAGNALFWVKVPEISATNDTTLYVSSNNNVEYENDPTDVWSQGYVGVWHMKHDYATNTTFVGGTPHSLDSTAQGLTLNFSTIDHLYENTSTHLGHGFTFDGVDDYMYIEGNFSEYYNATTGWTYTAMILNTGGGPTATIVKESETIDQMDPYAFMHYRSTLGDYAVTWHNETNATRTTAAQGKGSYADTDLILSAVYHENAMRLYLNGNLEQDTVGTINEVCRGTIYIGDTTHPYTGTIDEFRISNTSRNASWLGAMYENIINYNGFITRESGDGSYITYDLRNLDPEKTYYYRMVASNTQGTVYGAIANFTTTMLLGNITTNETTEITTTNATMHGYLRNRGGETCSVWFEWGTTPVLGNTTTEQTGGENQTAYAENLSGLTENTRYYYRAVANNTGGRSYGSIREFTTLAFAPNTTTDEQVTVGATTVTVYGCVDACGGADAQAWVEYGTTPSYGNTSAMQTITMVNYTFTIQHNLIGEDLTDFPVLVKIPYEDIGLFVENKRKTDCDFNADLTVDYHDLDHIIKHYFSTGPPGWVIYDVNNDGEINMLEISIINNNWCPQDPYDFNGYFTDDEGNELSWDVEIWNSTENETHFWVKVPAISATEDTNIYLNVGSGHSNRPEDVWSNDFVEVWNMGADNRSMTFGKTYNSIIGETDQMGTTLSVENYTTSSGRGFNFNGVDEYLSFEGDFDECYDGTTGYTYTAIIRNTNGSKNTTIVKESNTLENQQPYGGLFFDATLNDYVARWHNATNATKEVAVQGKGPGSQDVLIAQRYTGTTMDIVLNGATENYVATTVNETCRGNVYIGDDSNPFEGMVDMVRISSTPRSDEWLRATYSNVLEYDQFINRYEQRRIQITLINLTPNTKYYYRIGANNSGGIDYGVERNVTTAVNTAPEVWFLVANLKDQNYSSVYNHTFALKVNDTNSDVLTISIYNVDHTHVLTKENIPANSIVSLTMDGVLDHNTTYAWYAIANDSYLSHNASGMGSPWFITSMAYDINEDGACDLDDISLLLADYGRQGQPKVIPADISGNGRVDVPDISSLVCNYGWSRT